MPANDVSITAVFQPSPQQTAWDKAFLLIENATFVLTQEEAQSETLARARLAYLINQLIAPTGFVISLEC